MIRHISSFALLSGLAIAIAACGDGDACTLLGCADKLTVIVESASALEPGSYDLRLTSASGSDESCIFEVSAECDGAACMESCEIGRVSGGQLHLIVDGNPESVALTLTRDGTSLVNETRTPQYEGLHPNGKECDPDPVCYQATETVNF